MTFVPVSDAFSATAIKSKAIFDGCDELQKFVTDGKEITIGDFYKAAKSACDDPMTQKAIVYNCMSKEFKAENLA